LTLAQFLVDGWELADGFEHAPMGLHWVGPDGLILRVNEAELTLLGYQRDEYLGHHIAEFHAAPHVCAALLRRWQ
jgi:PAS domain S-box-containing protein